MDLEALVEFQLGETDTRESTHQLRKAVRKDEEDRPIARPSNGLFFPTTTDCHEIRKEDREVLICI